MVNAKLHIICGNCGQDLTVPGEATWRYIPAEVYEDEVLASATVYITCENCATIHSLSKYIKEESE